MKKKELNHLYEFCKEFSMKNEELIYLLKTAKSEEEKEFYIMVKNHFLKKDMEKVIMQNRV